MISLSLGTLCIYIGGTVAGKKLHSGMLRAVMRSSMSFFDTTPIGRTLNRFSKDTDTVDSVLPSILNSAHTSLWKVCAYENRDKTEKYVEALMIGDYRIFIC